MQRQIGSDAIQRLIDTRTSGYALDSAFYVQDEIFARDMDLLLGGWTCAGHESDVPEAGDYLVAEIGLQSAIVVRGDDGALRAMANVCRHRGTKLVGEPRGNAKSFVCPYHAWTYGVEGALLRVPHRACFPSLRPEDTGLVEVPPGLFEAPPTRHW